MSAPVQGRPRTYRRPISVWWWLKKPTYLLFVLRELSSIFIAWLVAFLVVMVFAIGRGADSYQAFMDWAGSAWVMVINIVAFLFTALHTVTWFLLTPKAMALRARGRAVPAGMIIVGEYVALAIVSAFVVWLVFL
ncbi:fumarate reductase subunit C [Microlunatus sp. Gsoil 973]|uniref:fumarate reductase subunit C n=1 Tax=Microlunatus sp. Gsoil 973 TaxID=2672569 RepID=UPI0012B47D9E|nr:fumarate reductase subunit C [Microlunatus sp. Gsoil 973]QGN32091.1 fumarate reductase subunit C [Microlunatus sp. Gsoil 973]